MDNDKLIVQKQKEQRCHFFPERKEKLKEVALHGTGSSIPLTNSSNPHQS